MINTITFNIDNLIYYIYGCHKQREPNQGNQQCVLITRSNRVITYPPSDYRFGTAGYPPQYQYCPDRDKEKNAKEKKTITNLQK